MTKIAIINSDGNVLKIFVDRNKYDISDLTWDKLNKFCIESGYNREINDSNSFGSIAYENYLGERLIYKVIEVINS